MKAEKKSILIIDDSKEIREILTLYLKDSGHSVTTVSDGSYGLEVLKKEEFQLIICDIIMPILDGIEVITKIKRDMPSMNIIAMSSGGKLAKHDFLPLAIKTGADAVLYKPFNKSDLFETMQTLGVD